jgi:AraC-like DNA-binding protein
MPKTFANRQDRRKISADGIEMYLQGTANKHNGMGFKVFEVSIRVNLAKSAIARLFKVSGTTIDNWLAIYRAEQAKADKALELDSK